MSWAWVEEFLYTHYLDRHIEETGHLVEVDYSSPSTLWMTLHQKYQPYYLYNCVYLFLLATYFIAGGLFVIFEETGFLQKYKINPKPTSGADYISCFKNLALNFLLVIPFMNTLGWPAFKMIGLDWRNEFPTLPIFLFHIACCLVLEDFGHYILHRILHIKALYPLIHKVHHEFIAPFALSATQAHPIETAILGIATFYPSVVLKDFHLFTFYCWIVLRSLDANLEHCGYDLTRNLHWIPFYGGTAFHDKHHTSFNYNFASRFTYLDKLLGTYKEPESPETHVALKPKALKNKKVE